MSATPAAILPRTGPKIIEHKDVATKAKPILRIGVWIDKNLVRIISRAINKDMITKVRVVFILNEIPPLSMSNTPHKDKEFFSVAAECDNCTANQT